MYLNFNWLSSSIFMKKKKKHICDSLCQVLETEVRDSLCPQELRVQWELQRCRHMQHSTEDSRKQEPTGGTLLQVRTWKAPWKQTQNLGWIARVNGKLVKWWDGNYEREKKKWGERITKEELSENKVCIFILCYLPFWS